MVYCIKSFPEIKEDVVLFSISFRRAFSDSFSNLYYCINCICFGPESELVVKNRLNVLKYEKSRAYIKFSKILLNEVNSAIDR